MRILFLRHPKIPQAGELASTWSEHLTQLGASVRVATAWHNSDLSSLLADTDLAITLGGDGTILFAARACAPLRVPILGVKLGRVGFLSEISPEQFDARAIIQNTYWVEERMMLHATLVRRGEQVGTFQALNEIVVSRGKLARVTRLGIHVDGELLTALIADGAIVATPTGSSAYAAAAGGPILSPALAALIWVPIAPYHSSMRALVLPPTVRIDLQVHSRHPALMSADGQTDVELEMEDTVSVIAGKHPARFARFQARSYFYRTLYDRLRDREGQLHD